MEGLQPAALMALIGKTRQDIQQGLACSLTDYIELVDWTGRIIRSDKPGAIAEDLLRVSTVNEAKPFKLIEGVESAFTLHSFMVRAQSSDVKTKPFGCSQARSRDSAAPSAFWSPCRVNARSFVTGASPSTNSKVFSIFTLN